MSDAPGFIYVLMEREFVKSGEPIIKVGRTSSDIVQRLAGYSKGSKLLFCMYCDSVVATETEVLRLLDKAFKRRADYGRESFEGDLKSMIALVDSYVHVKLLAGSEVRPAALANPEIREKERRRRSVDDAASSTSSGAGPSKASKTTHEAVPKASKTTHEAVPKASKPTAEARPISEARLTPEAKPILERVGGADEPGTSGVVPVVQAAAAPKETVCPDQAIARFVEAHKAELDNAREVSASLYDRFMSFADSMNWTVSVKHDTFSKQLVKMYGAHLAVVRDGLVVNRYIQMPRLVSVGGHDKVDNPVLQFAKAHIERASGHWLLLMNAREAFKNSAFYSNDGLNTFKAELSQALGTQCHPQKWLDRHNRKNSFEGFKFVENF